MSCAAWSSVSCKSAICAIRELRNICGCCFAFCRPVIFLEGRHDLGTNATLLDQWFKTIRAPKKKLVWFVDSAHMVYQEEPGKTLVTLVNEVLPLTRLN